MSNLDAARLRATLGACVIGREIVVLAETRSTNDVVREMTAPEIGEGLVVFAEHQTAGRGQRGNVWQSAPGLGLLFSILLRPKISIDQSPRLTEWIAQTLAETIAREFSLAPRIKLPNDVYIDDRKIGGVLVEMRAQKNSPHVAIAGIGLNINQSAQDFPADLPAAGSIAMALGRSLDREALAISILRNLDLSYQKIITPEL